MQDAKPRTINELDATKGNGGVIKNFLSVLSPDAFVKLASKIGGFSIRAVNELKDYVQSNVYLDTSRKTTRQIAKKTRSNAKEIQKYVEESKVVLFEASTVFPLTLFKSTVIVDKTKVTIIQRTFFFTANVISLRIEDILSVTNSVGPFFGGIRVTTRVISSVDHFDINNFWRKDAIKLKHIIQGYIIAMHKDKNVGQLPKNKLLPILENLGHDATA